DDRQPVIDIAPEVGRYPLEATDGDRRAVDPGSAAGGLAGTIAGAAENGREYVRFPVDHVGVGVPPLSDQADILRHVGVRRTRPLTVHNLVEVVGIVDVGWFHVSAVPVVH